MPRRVLYTACALGLTLGTPPVAYGEDALKSSAGTVVVRVPKNIDEWFCVDPDEVTEVYAELFANPFGQPKIDRFSVPIASFKPILKSFEGCEVDPNPDPRFDQMGCITIVYRDGRTRQVTWFWPGGKGRLRMSIAGIRVRRMNDHWNGLDEGHALDGTLRKIRQDANNEAPEKNSNKAK